MTRTSCNGCGRELSRPTDVCLRIERCDGMGGGGVPHGISHLCNPCAVKAFAALKPAAKVPIVERNEP